MCDVSYAFAERPKGNGGPGEWTCTEGAPDAPVCEWGGVYCDQHGSVVSLSYTCLPPDDVLGGTLHPSIGSLTNISTIYLIGGCDVGGPLPAQLLDLRGLHILNLWCGREAWLHWPPKKKPAQITCC